MGHLGKIGAAIVNGTVFAVVGWALSLTQGPNAQRWPWILVGGLFGAGIALLLYDWLVGRVKNIGKVVFHQDGSVEITPGYEQTAASVGQPGPDQQVVYVGAIPRPRRRWRRWPRNPG